MVKILRTKMINNVYYKDSHLDAADKTGSWAGLITNIRLTASARSAVSEGTAYKLETKEKLGRFLIERKHLRRKKQ